MSCFQSYSNKFLKAQNSITTLNKSGIIYLQPKKHFRLTLIRREH